MNKLAIITSFLGAARNRYMVYQEERPLADKLAMAGGIDGIDGVELAYPADFQDLGALKELLARHALGISVVNFRSRRTGMWWRGSFTAESAEERAEVVDDLRRAMDAATELGCRRITTCPLNDGVDYPFEMDYVRAYAYAVETFSAACAHDRATRLCIEYKQSDPRARCLFGTAGEAAAFCQIVGADNLGVTLDIGHAIYAGERPAQSAALLARSGRLFYVHLNDNDGRWDWDMLPGAYHLWDFVEFFYTLRKLGYDGDWYGYDVFPKEIDTIETFRATVELTRKLEAITDRIDAARMEELMSARNPNAIVTYLYSLL
jgi:xylose isomerase